MFKLHPNHCVVCGTGRGPDERDNESRFKSVFFKHIVTVGYFMHSLIFVYSVVGQFDCNL